MAQDGSDNFMPHDCVSAMMDRFMHGILAATPQTSMREFYEEKRAP